MARKCKRKKTITILQDYGPAKKRRVCASYTSKRRKKGGKKRGTGWCVFKGKRKGVKHSCFRTKAKAKHAAAVLRRTCRSRIRVKRAA